MKIKLIHVYVVGLMTASVFNMELIVALIGSVLVLLIDLILGDDNE